MEQKDNVRFCRGLEIRANNYEDTKIFAEQFKYKKSKDKDGNIIFIFEDGTKARLLKETSKIQTI